MIAAGEAIAVAGAVNGAAATTGVAVAGLGIGYGIGWAGQEAVKWTWEEIHRPKRNPEGHKCQMPDGGPKFTVTGSYLMGSCRDWAKPDSIDVRTGHDQGRHSSCRYWNEPEYNGCWMRDFSQSDPTDTMWWHVAGPLRAPIYSA